MAPAVDATFGTMLNNAGEGSQHFLFSALQASISRSQLSNRPYSTIQPGGTGPFTVIFGLKATSTDAVWGKSKPKPQVLHRHQDETRRRTTFDPPPLELEGPLILFARWQQFLARPPGWPRPPGDVCRAFQGLLETLHSKRGSEPCL